MKLKTDNENPHYEGCDRRCSVEKSIRVAALRVIRAHGPESLSRVNYARACVQNKAHTCIIKISVEALDS